MSAPRILGYDDLWQWLEDMQEDANAVVIDYTEQGDVVEAAEAEARRQAFYEVQRHIEFELAVSRA